MKVKIWIISWLVIVVSVLSALGFWGYKVDPFFHYHKPDIDNYYYVLDNERSMNNGISRHFDYDAIITGTSMTQLFKTSEAEQLFKASFIKVPFSGARYKEINDNIQVALDANRSVKYVIRGLDTSAYYVLADDSSALREDLGTYPTYLYDNNPFNDVNYLLNRDVVFGRVYPMANSKRNGGTPGITPFDEYSWWQDSYSYGKNSIIPDGASVVHEGEDIHLSEEEKSILKRNVEKNIISVAVDHPDVEFYYFFTPYSILYWADAISSNTLSYNLEMEKCLIEMIIPYDNIHLYSFNTRIDIIADLNNYKDRWHYGGWINSLILKWMRDGDYEITKSNYCSYLQKEKDIFTSFDYDSLNNQADYEADYYAAALLNQELSGVKPYTVLRDEDTIKLASGRTDKYKLNIDSSLGYRYLSFYVQWSSENAVIKADEYNGGVCCDSSEVSECYVDGRKHHYVLQLSDEVENIELSILDSGSCFISDIQLY